MNHLLRSRKIEVALITIVLLARPAVSGVAALFADGFESGGTTVWERPTRYVVFEGFYVPT